MEDKKLDTSHVIEEIKRVFGAEIEQGHPNQDDLQFLQERDLLEEKVTGSFEMYAQNYELLQAYGLETKLINELEWFIVFTLEHNRDEFLESPFYQRFKDHRVVKRALLEHQRRKQL